MVFSWLLDDRPNPLADRHRDLIAQQPVLLAFQTVMELRYGALRAAWGELRRRRLERRIAELSVVQPDDEMITACASLRLSCQADRARARRPPPRRRPMDRRSANPPRGLIGLPRRRLRQDTRAPPHHHPRRVTYLSVPSTLDSMRPPGRAHSRRSVLACTAPKGACCPTRADVQSRSWQEPRSRTYSVSRCLARRSSSASRSRLASGRPVRRASFARR